MKTIKEHLAEADRKRLLDALAYHFLEDPIYLLELKDLAVKDIMEKYSRHMDAFIERLLTVEAEEDKCRVFYLYSDYDKGDALDLVSIEEISADIEAPGYDFSFSDWSSSLGCLVADTRQTQDNLISLLAQYLLEAGLFGTDTDARERKLEEVTEDLDKAMQDIHAGEGIPADEVFDEIRRKHGFPVPEKDPEQDGLKSRIYSAIAEYAMYNRTRERRRILASIAGT